MPFLLQSEQRPFLVSNLSYSELEHERMVRWGHSEDSFSYSNVFPQTSYRQKVWTRRIHAFSTLEASTNDDTESLSGKQNPGLVSSEFYRVMITEMWKVAAWHRIKQ